MYIGKLKTHFFLQRIRYLYKVRRFRKGIKIYVEKMCF